MTVLKGEGTHSIIYGNTGIYAGLRRNHGYVARTDHAGAFPTVILAHDVWGITSYVKDLARKLARHGLNVVVPDLYEGAAPNRTLPWEDAAGFFKAKAKTRGPIEISIQFIESDDTPWVRPGSLGALALGHGAGVIDNLNRERRLDSLALVAPIERPETVGGVPGIAIYGKADEVAGEPTRGPGYEWVLYEGVKHDFLNDHGPDYAEAASWDAIDRIAAFFVRTLS